MTEQEAVKERLKLSLTMLAVVALAVLIMWWLFHDLPDKLAQARFAQQYNILNDSFVAYKKDAEGRIHAQTQSNYVTPEELKLLNKQLYNDIKAIVNGDMKRFMSNLKVTVVYPERKDSGITHFDSLLRRIDLKEVNDSCVVINSYVDSLKIGHTGYQLKPQKLEFNTFWKKGRLFGHDTLIVDGLTLSGCGTITSQKSIIAKPKAKRNIEKPGTLLGIGAAIGIAIFKIFKL